ncbi:AraC family transcriptional regulator [bacterium]|nr:MAG: AraC family transcriptional regulator [bacterium]
MRSDAAPPKIVFGGAFEGGGDFPEHRHENAWELVYLQEGAVTQKLLGTEVEMRPGTFVVHPPETVHGDSARDRYVLFHVLVTCDGHLGWPRQGSDLDGSPVGTLLGLVVREWYSNGAHREAFLRHCASLLDILMRRCAVQSEESLVSRSVVAEVCGRFRREFRGSIDMGRIAQDLGISRSTLYGYFKRVLGRPPQEVLDGIRLKHAVHLLRHSKLSVEDVALGSGYCSASHLGRKLRKALGKTARQVRG